MYGTGFRFAEFYTGNFRLSCGDITEALHILTLCELLGIQWAGGEMATEWETALWWAISGSLMLSCKGRLTGGVPPTSPIAQRGYSLVQYSQLEFTEEEQQVKNNLKKLGDLRQCHLPKEA